MKKIENVSRRGFLKKIGVGSGALVMGVQFSSLLPSPNVIAQGIALSTNTDNQSFQPNENLTDL